MKNQLIKEDTIFEQRKHVVSLYPRDFLGYEQKIFEQENIDEVKDWRKHRGWMKKNNLKYEHMAEEEQY